MGSLKQNSRIYKAPSSPDESGYAGQALPTLKLPPSPDNIGIRRTSRQAISLYHKLF